MRNKCKNNIELGDVLNMKHVVFVSVPEVKNGPYDPVKVSLGDFQRVRSSLGGEYKVYKV